MCATFETQHTGGALFFQTLN